MSTITAPRAPRVMVQRARSGSEVQSLEPIFQNEAGKLYQAPSGHDMREICRDFLDSFAYLCDFEKGGATVTATALQKGRFEGENILWLAANEGIRRDVKVYAEAILEKIKNVNTNTQETVQDKIFLMAVHMCSHRLRFYKAKVQIYARNCRTQLKEDLVDVMVQSLRRKLKKLTLADLVDYCYIMRGDQVEEIKRRSTESKDDFDGLAHYIGRLGTTRSSAATVVRAMLQVPALRQIAATIYTVEAPGPREVTIDQEHLIPYEIVRAICEESTSQYPMQTKSALHAVVDLDLPPNNEIRTALVSQRTIRTWVHAELQIADRFSRDKTMYFVDNDKYIGCSKPACYFCHSWLFSHEHKYVVPATHCKILTGCRGPDNDLNEAGANVLRKLYTKLRKALDDDIIKFLLNSQRGRAQSKDHYMSTEGSSRAPSQFSTKLVVEAP